MEQGLSAHVVGGIKSEGLLVGCGTQQAAHLEEEPEGNHVAQHPDCTAMHSSAATPEQKPVHRLMLAPSVPWNTLR